MNFWCYMELYSQVAVEPGTPIPISGQALSPKIGHTLERMDEEGKCSLKELIWRNGLPPEIGSLNDPPPNPDDYNEGKATYINEPSFHPHFQWSRRTREMRSDAAIPLRTQIASSSFALSVAAGASCGA